MEPITAVTVVIGTMAIGVVVVVGIRVTIGFTITMMISC